MLCFDLSLGIAVGEASRILKLTRILITRLADGLRCADLQGQLLSLACSLVEARSRA